MSTPRRRTARDCARALWLLGLTPPVAEAELTKAWRERVRRTHPDRHAGAAGKEAAAIVLTRALNDAREVVAAWIAAGLEWPEPARGGAVRLDEHAPEPWPEREPEPEVATVCKRTGLRAGDRVRVWPFDGEVLEVAGTDVDGPDDPVWVRLRGAGAERAERVRLAAYGCPVCGFCAGPSVEDPVLRPCPDCLADLRLLARRPREAGRVRRAIEARADAGIATARSLDDPLLADRALGRRNWARLLREAEPEDLQAALLGAFSRAWDRWGGGERFAER